MSVQIVADSVSVFFVAEQLRIIVMESNVVGVVRSILTYLDQRQSMVASGIMTRTQMADLIVAQVDVCIAHMRSVPNIHPGINLMYVCPMKCTILCLIVYHEILI